MKISLSEIMNEANAVRKMSVPIDLEYFEMNGNIESVVIEE